MVVGRAHAGGRGCRSGGRVRHQLGTVAPAGDRSAPPRRGERYRRARCRRSRTARHRRRRPLLRPVAGGPAGHARRIPADRPRPGGRRGRPSRDRRAGGRTRRSLSRHRPARRRRAAARGELGRRRGDPPPRGGRRRAPHRPAVVAAVVRRAVGGRRAGTGRGEQRRIRRARRHRPPRQAVRTPRPRAGARRTRARALRRVGCAAAHRGDPFGVTRRVVATDGAGRSHVGPVRGRLADRRARRSAARGGGADRVAGRCRGRPRLRGQCRSAPAARRARRMAPEPALVRPAARPHGTGGPAARRCAPRHHRGPAARCTARRASALRGDTVRFRVAVGAVVRAGGGLALGAVGRRAPARRPGAVVDARARCFVAWGDGTRRAPRPGRARARECVRAAPRCRVRRCGRVDQRGHRHASAQRPRHPHARGDAGGPDGSAARRGALVTGRRSRRAAHPRPSRPVASRHPHRLVAAEHLRRPSSARGRPDPARRRRAG